MKDLETGEQMLWRGRRGWKSVGLIVRKLKRGKMLASELPSRPISGCKKLARVEKARSINHVLAPA